MGVIKGDARSLDRGSYVSVRSRMREASWRAPPARCPLLWSPSMRRGVQGKVVFQICLILRSIFVAMQG